MSDSLLSGFSGAFGAAVVNGILTGSTRQIVWPLLDQLGSTITAFGGDPSALPTLGLAQGVVQGIAASLQSGFSGYVAIAEDHQDELEITTHPVEQGATISDHAYKLPATLNMQVGWSTSTSLSSAAPSILGLVGQPIQPLDVASLFTGGGSDIFIHTIYQQFLTLQANRTLLTIYTGKRVYNNMLIQTVGERTNAQTEHALVLTLTFKEIILAQVQTVNVPTNSSAQSNPQVTSPSTNQGTQSLQPSNVDVTSSF